MCVHYLVTKVSHSILSWSKWICSTPLHHISLRRVIFSHLCLGLPRGHFHAWFRTKLSCVFLIGYVFHPFHSPRFDHRNVWWRVSNETHYAFCSSCPCFPLGPNDFLRPCYLLSRRSKHSPQILFICFPIGPSISFRPCSLLSCRSRHLILYRNCRGKWNIGAPDPLSRCENPVCQVWCVCLATLYQTLHFDHRVASRTAYMFHGRTGGNGCWNITGFFFSCFHRPLLHPFRVSVSFPFFRPKRAN